jgi:hypothetical protein
MITMWRAFFLAIAIVALAVGDFSVAEDNVGAGPGLKGDVAAEPPPCPDIKWGDYEPLTFWRKLKLGTAFYVNPEVASPASVSYVYPTSLMNDPAKAKQVLTAVKSGTATLAQQKPDGDFFIVPPQNAKEVFGDMWSQPTSDNAFLSGKGYWIAANMGDLAGVKPSKVVVSFDPTSSCLLSKK